MGSTTTLRCDTARTGTNPDFTINGNPWRKYVSVDLGQTTVGGKSYDRTVRAGVLVVENWLFNAGPHLGETRTLVLVATTTNEVFCYSEGALLENGAAATPLWQRSLGVPPIVSLWSASRNPPYSNIRPLLGVCGTPVVDTVNRRMFVVAMWDDGSGKGRYSIFSIALDTGNITASQELVYAGAQKFDASVVDQRTAINLVGGWLWFGFGAFFAFDLADYFGWVVAVNPDDLTQQLFQPMISQNSSNSGSMPAAYGGRAASPRPTMAASTRSPETRPASPRTIGRPISFRLGRAASAITSTPSCASSSTLRAPPRNSPYFTGFRIPQSPKPRTPPIGISGLEPSCCRPSPAGNSSPSCPRTATSTSSTRKISAISPHR